MPVFETGAFNHSATCPAARKLLGTVTFFNLLDSAYDGFALAPEKIFQQSSAFFCQNTTPHLRPVIQERVTEQIAN
jgi:hypothetical protein